MPEELIDAEFVLEEYRHCQDLINKNMDTIETNEVYAIAAIAVTVEFSLTSSSPTVAIISSFVPLFITLAGVFRFIALNSMIEKTNRYLLDLEKKHPSLGWTTFCMTGNRRNALRISRYAFWFSLGALCVVFEVITKRYGH